MGEVCKDVGLPPGILNIITGLGSEAGAPLASHPNVDKVGLFPFVVQVHTLVYAHFPCFSRA